MNEIEVYNTITTLSHLPISLKCPYIKVVNDNENKIDLN